MQRANRSMALLFVIAQIFNVGLVPTVWAADKPKDDTKKEETKKTIVDETKLSYPELEVTPRASDRLEMEAKNEARTHWATHLPIQFSALATIYAGTASKYASGLSDSQQANYDTTKKIAVGIGVGWLALTASLSAYYKPYFNGYKDVVKMPANNQREELTRERIAEEALYTPDAMAQKLKWFSVATNLAINIALLQNDSGASDFSVGIGILGSLAPLIFDYRWTTVADKHREYKKKIYGPIASAMLLPSAEHQYQPGLGVLWSF
jgi:hypothetical protein